MSKKKNLGITKEITKEYVRGFGDGISWSRIMFRNFDTDLYRYSKKDIKLLKTRIKK